MKIILFIAFCFASLSSLSQTKQDLSWYKMFSGKIDKSSVTLHLYKADHGYSGYYYYDESEHPFYFFGNDTTVKGKIQLSGGLSGQEEYFSFSVEGNKITGNWKKNETATPINFSALEVIMPLSFTYVFTKGSAKLRPKLKESPQADFDAASVWPTGNSATNEFIRTAIRKMFAEKNSKKEISVVLLETKRKFLETYPNDYKEVKDEELKESIGEYNISESDQLAVCFQSSRILSLSFFNYSYTGGAHGNYGTTYSSFDLVKNRQLELKDILNEQGIKKLRKLLEQNFRKQFNLKPTDALTEGGLFENKIEPNKNFCITGKGIMFSYYPYEIASFAMGEIDIFIPFNEFGRAEVKAEVNLKPQTSNLKP